MRNGVRVEEDSNHMTSQIIVDTSANTVYNNTLRVRGRESGRYICALRNNRHDSIAQDDSQDGLSVMRTILGKIVVVFQYLCSLSCIVFSCPRTFKFHCYIQDTYQNFTGVDVSSHPYLLIFLCGILSVWRRGLQCGLHH